MELCQMYLIVGLAMGLVMLLETEVIYTSSLDVYNSTGIPVILVVSVMAAIIIVAGCIAWPWILYKEIQYSQNSSDDIGN